MPAFLIRCVWYDAPTQQCVEDEAKLENCKLRAGILEQCERQLEISHGLLEAEVGRHAETKCQLKDFIRQLGTEESQHELLRCQFQVQNAP